MQPRTSQQSFRRTVTALLAVTSVLVLAAIPGAQSVGECEITIAVGTALERLPGYGVFDSLAFQLERGAVTVHGYAYTPGLGSAATEAVKRLAGIEGVNDRVEELPVSASDDRIRWITFFEIYTDDVLSRYAPGGASGARFDVFQFGAFPGTQPGGYPIHIIVNGGRTTLVGAVDSALDRQLAAVRAWEVWGVFAVDNQLVTTH